MLDLRNVSAEESKAMQSTLKNNLLANHNSALIFTKLVQAYRINGSAITLNPGMGMANGLATWMPHGKDVTMREMFTYPKTVQLQTLDRTVPMFENDIRKMDSWGGIVNFISASVMPAWANTVLAGVIEYITQNAGFYGVLDPSTNTTGFDGLPTFSPTHYSGALDNTQAFTGPLPNEIAFDWWQLTNKMRSGMLPESNIPYWGISDLMDLGVVVLHPVALSDQMHNVFKTEIGLAMINGANYDAATDNPIGKIAPQLVACPLLDRISTTSWYVLFTSKAAHASQQAVSLFLNSDFGLGPTDSPDLRAGIPVGGDFIEGEDGAPSGGGLFTVQISDPQSSLMIISNKVVASSKSKMGFLCGNPYRIGQVA